MQMHSGQAPYRWDFNIIMGIPICVIKIRLNLPEFTAFSKTSITSINIGDLFDLLVIMVIMVRQLIACGGL